MKKQIIVIMLLMLIALTAIPVSAQTITMANPGGVAERDIIVYYPNQTMYGYFNSTSVITLDGATDYIFAMKPIGANPLEDPGDFLSGIFTYMQTNVIALMIIVGLIGLAFMRRH
jgi:hypothetical protein